MTRVEKALYSQGEDRRFHKSLTGPTASRTRGTCRELLVLVARFVWSLEMLPEPAEQWCGVGEDHHSVL